MIPGNIAAGSAVLIWIVAGLVLGGYVFTGIRAPGDPEGPVEQMRSADVVITFLAFMTGLSGLLVMLAFACFGTPAWGYGWWRYRNPMGTRALLIREKPLLQAIRSRRYDAVVPMLQKGERLKYLKHSAPHLLCAAVASGDMKMLQLLLDAGLKAAACDSLALEEAAMRGDEAMAASLVKAGARPRHQGCRAITAAATAGHLSLVKAWSSDAPSRGNMSVLLASIFSGNEYLVRFWIEKKRLNRSSLDCGLIEALDKGAPLPVVRVLLDAGANVKKAWNGHTHGWNWPDGVERSLRERIERDALEMEMPAPLPAVARPRM